LKGRSPFITSTSPSEEGYRSKTLRGVRLAKPAQRYEEERMMILVEKATEQELEAIRALDVMVTGDVGRKDFLANAVRAGQCLVARIGGTMVGFGVLDQSYGPFNGQGFISLLITHPDHRRRGVATALIHHIEPICPTEKLFTSTDESNVIAQQVYESLGFVRSGYIENVADDDREIIYFKRLRGGNATLT